MEIKQYILFIYLFHINRELKRKMKDRELGQEKMKMNLGLKKVWIINSLCSKIIYLYFLIFFWLFADVKSAFEYEIYKYYIFVLYLVIILNFSDIHSKNKDEF